MSKSTSTSLYVPHRHPHQVRALEAELNIAEREQIVLCEREKFAEAEEISDKIEGLKKKIADLTKKGNNRSDEFLLEHEYF